MKTKRVLLKIQNDAASSLRQVIEQYNNIYIDGTLHNSFSGMNWSCAGIKDDCLMIFMEKPPEVDFNEFVAYRSILKSNGDEISLEGKHGIWIHEEIVGDIQNDEYLSEMEIVVSDPDSNPPMLYLHLQ